MPRPPHRNPNKPAPGWEGCERNQCDGCQRGLPIIDGLHDLTGTTGAYPGEKMVCTRDRYLKVVTLNAGKKAPADLSKTLREIADAIDRGEVTGLVAGLMNGGSYEFVYGASYSECLELATLLQYRCIEKFKA